MTAYWNRTVAWWEGRTRREQIMLGVMGALIVGLIAWYGVVAPISGWRTDAAERREAAAGSLASVQGDIALINAEASARPLTAEQQVEPLLTRTAGAAGLTLDRQQAEADGSQTAWLVAAPPQALFGWLATLEQTHGVTVVNLTVLKSTTGSGLDVQASFRSAPQ